MNIVTGECPPTILLLVLRNGENKINLTQEDRGAHFSSVTVNRDLDKAICIKLVDIKGFVHGDIWKVWSEEAVSLGDMWWE